MARAGSRWQGKTLTFCMEQASGSARSVSRVVASGTKSEQGAQETYHAEQARDERSCRQAESSDADAQIEAEKRVTVRVEDELDDVLGMADIRLQASESVSKISAGASPVQKIKSDTPRASRPR